MQPCPDFTCFVWGGGGGSFDGWVVCGVICNAIGLDLFSLSLFGIPLIFPFNQQKVKLFAFGIYSNQVIDTSMFPSGKTCEAVASHQSLSDLQSGLDCQEAGTALPRRSRGILRPFRALRGTTGTLLHFANMLF